MSATRDELLDQRAEARGYKRGLQAAIIALVNGPVGDGLLRKRVAAIAALIPAYDPS
jgi:hypothetical protein